MESDSGSDSDVPSPEPDREGAGVWHGDGGGSGDDGLGAPGGPAGPGRPGAASGGGAGGRGHMDPATMHKLDPRVVVYWLVTGIFGALVLLAILLTGAWFAADHFEEWGYVVWWVAGVLGGVNLLWALISPPWAYARWRYAVDDQLMRMRYGIFFHEERSIPINRMQHADLTRGPIERLFGLASLVVFSAGNDGSAFRVPGVDATRAGALRDQILAARGDDVI